MEGDFLDTKRVKKLSMHIALTSTCLTEKSQVSAAQWCHLFGDPMSCSLPGSAAHGFSRQEYWSVLPFPPPGDFLNQGSNLGLLHFRQNLYHLSHQGSCLTEWLHFNCGNILLLKVDHNYYPAYCLFVVKFSHKVSQV